MEDAGFKIIIPAWLTPKGRRRAKVRLRSGGKTKTASASAQAYFSMETLTDYHYELAIGDETLTPEEWQQLVDAKAPLIHFRGQWMELDRENMQDMLAFMQQQKSSREIILTIYPRNPMRPELRQAIIKANSDYFSWDKARQEKYGQDIPEAEYKIIKGHLYKTLFGITLKNDDAEDQCTPEQTFLFNQAILPLAGMGDNCFFLNEMGSKGALDFETWYDYDFDDHEFQESSNAGVQEGYTIRPYKGRTYPRWARMLIDDKFYYVTLLTEAGFLCNALSEVEHDYINELIPYDFVEGKNHGKKEKGGSLWDMRRDANGLEAQLDELETRLWDYQRSRHDYLVDQCFNEQHKAVYFVDVSGDELDPCMTIIASDPSVMKEIHFKSIVADCRRYEQEASAVLLCAESEKALLKSFLKNQFDDIMANFDTKVVKLKKKRKVIVCDGVVVGAD